VLPPPEDGCWVGCLRESATPLPGDAPVWVRERRSLGRQEPTDRKARFQVCRGKCSDLVSAQTIRITGVTIDSQASAYPSNLVRKAHLDGMKCVVRHFQNLGLFQRNSKYRGVDPFDRGPVPGRRNETSKFADDRVRRFEEVIDRAGLAHEFRVDGQAEAFPGSPSGMLFKDLPQRVIRVVPGKTVLPHNHHVGSGWFAADLRQSP